jgi:hypothetical protein
MFVKVSSYSSKMAIYSKTTTAFFTCVPHNREEKIEIEELILAGFIVLPLLHPSSESAVTALEQWTACAAPKSASARIPMHGKVFHTPDGSLHFV